MPLPGTEVPRATMQMEVFTAVMPLPGTEVPRATMQMAVMESFIPMVQPTWEATSPIRAVTRPIPMILIVNEGYPPITTVGRRGWVRLGGISLGSVT